MLRCLAYLLAAYDAALDWADDEADLDAVTA